MEIRTFENARARGIEPHIVDDDLRSRHDQRRGDEEYRRGEIAGHGEARGCSPGTRRHTHGSVRQILSRQIRERNLQMISR